RRHTRSKRDWSSDVCSSDLRLPVARIKERWAAYEAGLEAGGHDASTRALLLAQSALWRNVYVAESDARAEDELSALLLQTRAHRSEERRVGEECRARRAGSP